MSLTLWFWTGPSKQVLREQLKCAEEQMRHLRSCHHVYVLNQIVMQRELANAHAALRRKGKALKILHKRLQANKETL